MNTRRFRASLDYSLELIKLQEVYDKVYRNRRFTFSIGKKQYTKFVVSVTFKYAVKEYNRIRKNVYYRHDVPCDTVQTEDCVALSDSGELLAIQVETPVTTPVDESVLGKFFTYSDNCYHAKTNIKTVRSVSELRNMVYQKGFYLDGTHYVRYKRSAGSARVGKCLFIAEPLYSQMHKWELCGLKIRSGDAIDLAAFESYIALTTSSIIGMVDIKPRNILVVDDYHSVFKDRVVNVKDADGRLVVNDEDVDVDNSIWDGMSLIDPSLMGEYNQYGFILLRNRFFKSAAFNFNLQTFFADNGITSVSQLSGYTQAQDLSDVKLITTPSSIKYCKFGSVEQWMDNIETMFGVVKHEKPTHYFGGRLVSCHYQLLNTLQMSYEDVCEFMRPTLEYLSALKSDTSVMRYHVKFAQDCDLDEITPARSKNDVVYKMLGITDAFARTKLYYDFKTDVVDSYTKNVRSGHVMVDGNYSTMCGNPVEMAQSAIGQFGGKSILGAGKIYCTRFAFGKELVGSRSPHVTMGNVLITENRHNPLIERYCNVTNEIVVVDSISDNLLNRLSGADFDSDTVMLIDNDCLLRAAKRNYNKFLVPTGSVESVKTKRKYTASDLADLDFKTSHNLIGQIVNLSQELNTLLWDKLNKGCDIEDVRDLYYGASLLDVLSNVEIDRAKREFKIDSAYEIKRLREKYMQKDAKGRQIKPNFFGHVARQKGYYNSIKKNYKAHMTTMDYLQKCLSKARKQVNEKRNIIPFSSIVKSDFRCDKVDRDAVEHVLEIVKTANAAIKAIWNANDDLFDAEQRYKLAAEVRQEAIEYIDAIELSPATMRSLLLSIESPENKDVARVIFFSLFGAPNKSFYALINESRTPIKCLEESEDGDISLYGVRFASV